MTSVLYARERLGGSVGGFCIMCMVMEFGMGIGRCSSIFISSASLLKLGIQPCSRLVCAVQDVVQLGHC